MKYIVLIISFVSIIQFSIQDKVTKIDKDNYKSLVLDSKKQWILLFHSPKCGSCQEFEPTWNSLLEKVDHSEFGIVDVEDPKGNQLAQELDVLNEGIPNLKFIANEDHIYSVKKGTETFELKDLIRRLTILDVKAQRGFFKNKKDKKDKRKKEDL